MSSRTPIRLTPYRGPLATPSTSPESSPMLSTPPSDLFPCSTPSLEVAILQHRISSLNPPPGHRLRSRLHRWRHEVAKEGLSSLSVYLCRGALMVECLVYSACELTKALAGILAFCLLIWGVLEWSSYVSKLSQQPNIWIPASRLPLPSSTRYMRCHVNPSLCELSDQHVAVLQFLSEQIQHARAMSSLSIDLDAPLRTFFDAHRATIHRVMASHNFPEIAHIAQEVDTLANLTEVLEPPVLDFAPGGFIGRSFTLALDELDDLISETMTPHASFPYEDREDTHLHAMYWRTASNLLLEYSAARPRARRLLQHVHALHQQLSPLVPGLAVVESIEKRLNVRWWKGIARFPTTSVVDEVRTFVAGLEVTLDNVHRLIAYLDWITERLAHTTLGDVLKTGHKPELSSCMTSLQELFARSKSPAPKKHGFRRNDYGVASLSRPERVDIMVPGSRTIAER